MDQRNLKFQYLKKLTCPPWFPSGWAINSKLTNKCGIWNIDRTAYQPKLSLLNCKRRCSANSYKKNLTKQCHTFLLEALRVGYFFEFSDLTPYPPRNPPFDCVASCLCVTGHGRTANLNRATLQSWSRHDHCSNTLCITNVHMNCKLSYHQNGPTRAWTADLTVISRTL